MAARCAFGEFLISAREHARASAQRRGVFGGEGEVQEVIDSLLRVVTVMGRYVDEVAVPGEVRYKVRPPLTAWGRARVNAREALTNAAAHLHQHSSGRRRPGVTARSELAWRLDAISVSLTAGRDLLHTHLARDPHGAREFHSEWGPVVTFPPVEQALLAELGRLAHLIVPPCIDLALVPGARDTADARRSLNGASQWLWVLSASVRTAQCREPVSATDRELLHAVPLNAVPPRRVPDSSTSVAALYDIVITSAERARHAAWVAGTQPAWSPRMTADSLHRAAATSTVTSHHCEILLRSLAASTADGDMAELSVPLLRAADAAGRARAGWLGIAQALNQVATDTYRHLAPAPSEASDLTLCTGRLAYADPGWTLSSGPGHQPRPSRELAPEPGDIPLAVSAVHYACDAVTSLAYAERERVRTAATAARLLVPTKTLPDTMDIPRPYAPALPDRIDALLSLYQDTGRDAAAVTALVGDAAAAVRAPSRVLTAARAAQQAVRNGRSGRPQHTAGEPSVASEPRELLSGRVENVLHVLGVNSPDLLRRAAEIDRASEQLITDASERRTMRYGQPSPVTRSRSAGSVISIKHALPSDDRQAVAVLRHQTPVQAEAEP